MELEIKVKKLIKKKLGLEEVKRHQIYIDYMLHNRFFDIIYYLENKNDFFN